MSKIEVSIAQCRRAIALIAASAPTGDDAHREACERALATERRRLVQLERRVA